MTIRAAGILMSAALVASLSAGCGRFARSGTEGASDERATARVDHGVTDVTEAAVTTAPVPSPTESSAAGAAPRSTAATMAPGSGGDAEGGAGGDKGGFDLTVVGRNGKPRAGITATVSGPASLQLTSGSDGHLRFQGAPGRYEVRIEATCGPVLEVRGGATGKVGVAADQTATGTLQIDWRHRYAPGPPVSYSDAANPGATASRGGRWPVGTPYVAKFAVLDRCTGKPAPGARFPTYWFSSQSEVKVQPQSDPIADSEGNGFVRLSCTAPVSDIELVSSDAEAPTDRLDLFDRASLDDSAPSCVS